MLAFSLLLTKEKDIRSLNKESVFSSKMSENFGGSEFLEEMAFIFLIKEVPRRTTDSKHSICRAPWNWARQLDGTEYDEQEVTCTEHVWPPPVGLGVAYEEDS